MAWFSFLAASIRWAIYPPPPGSAPGYQELHHCTAKGITSNEITISVLLKSGSIAILLRTSSCCNKASKPPTSGKPTK